MGGAPGLVDGRAFNPMPSMHAMAGGPDCRVALPAGSLPEREGGGRAWDLARFARRDGFSPVGTAWLQLGRPVDGSSLPPLDDPAASLLAEASVQVWDLDAGERRMHFAELDAFPEQADGRRSLLVRPLEHLGFGRRVAVVLTSALRSGEDGGPFEPPAAFAAIRDGEEHDGVPAPVRAHYEELLARLEALGVPRDELVFAWDYRTASADGLRAPLDVLLDAMRDAVPLDRGHQPALRITRLLDADREDDDGTPWEGTWREVRGAIEVPHFLWSEDGAAPDDAGIFRLDAAGAPEPAGPGELLFTAVVPDSLRGAAPGTVPVFVFGHGIFRNPQHYLASPDDPEEVVALARRVGGVFIGTEWRGLTERDIGDPVRVATDPARFPLITDKLVQGVANQFALARLLRTGLLDAEWLRAEGGGSLIDPARVHYYGISLGGIEGPVVLSNSDVLEGGVFHVPGSTWSTMLERSTNWSEFEDLMLPAMPDPADRQRVYALSQLLWDPVDPANHIDGLVGRPGLWQVSVGDDQVPDFTASLLARSMGLPLLGPAVEPIVGLAEREGPLGPGAQAICQYDSGLPRPPSTNRPAPQTDSHYFPRHTEEQRAQTAAFFEPGQLGTIVHPCDGPCVWGR